MNTKLSLAVLTLCFCVTATSAVNQKTQQGFLIKTELTCTSNGEEMKSDRAIILPANNKSWTTLVDPKNGVALLGRMVTSDLESIHIEYMILDTKEPNAVISIPAIPVLLGEPAEIGTKSDTVQVSIKLLASRTEYYSDNSNEE